MFIVMLLFFVSCTSESPSGAVVVESEKVAEKTVVVEEIPLSGEPVVAEPVYVPLSEETIPDGPVVAPLSPIDPVVLKRGVFVGNVSGVAKLVRRSDGTRLLFVEDFLMVPAAKMRFYIVSSVPSKGIDVGAPVAKKGSFQYPVVSSLQTSDVKEVVLYNAERDLVWGRAVLS